MNTQALLIELGTEELPPKALPELAKAFADGIAEAQTRPGHRRGAWFVFAAPSGGAHRCGAE
jgi:glycyl-tRNA synthetase beta chain